MRFTAHYISNTKPAYYQTVYADSINDAMRIAERWCKKCYILKTVKQEF